MSRCDAIVVEVSGREVLLEVSARVSACGACKTQDACQNSLLGLSAGPRRYRMENRIGARVGDRVKLTIAEGMLWRAALFSYLMPVALLVAGAAVGHSIAGDWSAVAGSLSGLVIGIALLRLREMRTRRESNLFSLQVQTREVRFKEQS